MPSVRSLISLSLVSPILAAAHLAAQPTSTIEFGATGGYTFFDSELPFHDRFGAGGFLGFFIIPRLALEGETSYAATQAGQIDIGYLPIRARLVYGQPLAGRLQLLLGAGFLQNNYFQDAGSAADDGVTGMLGLRLAIGRSLAFRMAGNADRTLRSVNTGANTQLDTWTFDLRAGFSVLVGPLFGGGGRPSGGPPPDLDGDGIADEFDLCPRTQRGVPVDRRGCELAEDADRDGIADAADNCPDTAAGVAVDARGCPFAADADGDGVGDAADDCPNTPAGVEVDRHGCPLPGDGDGDGVSDLEDACPNTGTGVPVNARGCPVQLDGDKDGVPDDRDACAATPAGVPVDARGCPIQLDSDKDGVPDDRDACAGTPAGAPVDARGCPLRTDGDGDGVADAKDACPDTPANQPVDERGCPVAPGGDRDRDGVDDSADRCPNSAAGQPVDERGCRVLFAGGSTSVVLERVDFVGEESYELTQAARVALDEVAESLRAHPELRVEIAGYTDNSGFRPYAVIRSLGRASAVRKYLIERGVAGERLSAQGYGPDQPLASNATAGGRARNNRIELRLLR